LGEGIQNIDSNINLEESFHNLEQNCKAYFRNTLHFIEKSENSLNKMIEQKIIKFEKTPVMKESLAILNRKITLRESLKKKKEKKGFKI